MSKQPYICPECGRASGWHFLWCRELRVFSVEQVVRATRRVRLGESVPVAVIEKLPEVE